MLYLCKVGVSEVVSTGFRHLSGSCRIVSSLQILCLERGGGGTGWWPRRVERVERSQHTMEFTSRRSASRTWGAMMRKNFKLKSRGCLCCCTVVEIVMPICFFALMCLPKVTPS